MNSSQSFSSRKPAPDLGLRPLHPLLRGIALLLVFVLTLTGPVPQVALAVATVGADGVATVEGDSEVQLRDFTTDKVSITPGAGFLGMPISLTAGTLSIVSLKGLWFDENAAAFADSTNPTWASITKGAFTLTLGSDGLLVPNNMAFALGSVLLSASQTWTAKSLDPGIDGAKIGDANDPVRVDSFGAGVKTLTVFADPGSDFTTTGIRSTEVFLDVGPSVNLIKTGGGNLWLLLGASGGTAFSGTLSINEGAVYLGDGFMTNALGAGAPGVSLAGVASLYVQGSNTISTLDGTGTVYGDGGQGDLTIDVGTGLSAAFSGKLMDEPTFAYLLAVRKAGKGSLSLSNTLSNFSGGLFLDEGILLLGANGLSSGLSGPYGTGELNVSGGTLRTTSGLRNLYNTLNFLTTGSQTSVAATVDATIAAGSLTVSSDVNVQSNTVLTLKAPLLLAAGLHGSYGLVKAGTSTLFISAADASTININSLTLREGTLVLNRNIDTRLVVDAVAGSAARYLTTTAGELVVSGAGKLALTLSADLVYSGSAGSALDFSAATETLVGGGTVGMANAGTVGVAVNAGTLVLGNLAPAGANPAWLGKSGAGILALKGTLGVNGLYLSEGTTAFGASGATQTFAGTLATSGAPTLSVVDGAKLRLTGVLGGSGFTKSGAGQLILGGSNAYSGTLSLAAGTLSFSGSPTFGASAQIAFAPGGTGLIQLTGANASLNLVGATEAANLIENGSAAAGTLTLVSGGTFAGVLRDGSGGGALALVKSGAGTALRLSGANLYTGGTTLNAGTLQIGSAGDIGSGSLAFTGGQLQFLTGFTTDLSSRFSGAGGQSFSVDTNAQNITFATGFGSGSSFAKSGAGKLTLAGDNLFTALTISSGTVQVGTGGTAGSTGNGSIANSGLLIFNRSDSYGGTFGGAISGTGALQLKSGLLTLGSVSAYTGTTTVTAGTLMVSGGLSGTSLLIGDATTGAGEMPSLLLAGSASLGRSVSVGSTSNANAFTAVLGGANTSGTTTFSGSVTLGTAASNYGVTLQAANGGTVAFQGVWTANNKPLTIGFSGSTGTVKLSSALATTGTVNVAYGTLSLGTNNALGSATPVTLSGTVLDLGVFSTSAGAVTLNGGSILGTGTLSAASYNVQSGIINGTIGGAGAFSKTGSGTVLLTAANPYTGVLTVSAGTVTFNGNGTTAGSIVNNGRVLFDSATDRILAGALSSSNSSGSFEKAGTSTLTISGGAASYTGATTISGGTLVLGGLIGSSFIQNDATLKLSLSAGGSFNGTISGGITILSATTPVTLTLGSTALLGGTVQIGSNVSLTLASGAKFGGNVVLNGGTINFGAANAFSAVTSAFTINSGVVNMGGFNQAVTNLALTAGSLLSSGSASFYYDNLTQSATVVQSPQVTLAVNSKTETFTRDGQAGIRLLSGVLGNVASGGSYKYVDASSERSGYPTLRFDQAITAAGSVSAIANNGTLFALSVEAPVNTPLFYVQNGIRVDFTNSGSLATTGTLAVDGEVTLSGSNGKTFGVISLQGGTFRNNGTQFTASASFTSLSATGGSLAASLSGSGDILKSGSGILSISGASQYYTGVLRVAGGTVTIGAGNALGTSGNVTLDSGSSLLQLMGNSITLGSLSGTGVIENGANAPSILTLSPTTPMSVSALLRNGQGGSSLSLVKAGTQTVTIDASQAYMGDTTVAAGTLILGSGVSLASGTKVEVTGGALDLGGNKQTVSRFFLTGGMVGGGTLEATSEYNLKSGVVNAILAGGASLTLGSDATTVTINTASTYTGATTITGGTLSLGASGQLGSTGSISITGGLLDLGSSSQSLANVVLAGGAVSGGSLNSNTGFDFLSGTAASILGGSAKLTKSGTGAVVLGAANSYSGGTQVDAGLLTLSVNGALPSSGSLAVGGGTLALGSTTQGAGSVTINGGSLTGGTLSATGYSVTSGLVTTKLVGTGASLAKSGAGTFTLNTAAGYDGGTTVTQGTLVLGLSNALAASGSVTVGGGLLSLGTSSQTVGAFTLISGSVTGGTLTGASYTLEAGNVSSLLAGAGALTKQNSGTVILSKANSFSGATAVNGGTLSSTTSGALGNTSSLSVDGGLLNIVDYNAAATLSVGGQGSAVVSGTGLSLAAVSNANTAANGVNFSASSGTITLAGLSGVGSTRFGSSATITNGGISGGAVTVLGLLNASVSGGIVSAGSLTTTGTISNGAVNVTGSASVANVTGGSLTAGGVATLGTVSGGTLSLGGATSSISSLLGGAIALSGNDVLTVSAGSFGGLISGSGSLVKAGAGSLTIEGAQTYNGTTTLRAGALTFTPAGSVAGALAVGDTSTGALDAPTLLLSGSGTVSNNLTVGAGAGSTFTATLGGSNTVGTAVFSGPVTLSSGGSAYSLVLQAATGGTVDFRGAWTANGKGLTVGSAGNSGTVKLSNVLSGAGLVSLTNGSTLLAGTGNIFGTSGTTTPVTVTGSTLNLGSFSVAAGTVTLTSGNIIGGTLSGTRYDVAAGTVASILAGGSTVVLNKTGAGTVTLSGANTYTGTTTVSAGTLAFEGEGKVSGAIVNSGNLAFNNSSDVSLSGLVSGSGSLVKNGGTTLTLNGGASYTGATTVTAGTLSVRGLLASGLIQNDATLRLDLVTSGTYSGSMSGNGTTWLSANSSPVTLTLGGSANFGDAGSTVRINTGVTVSMAAAARMLGSVILDGGTLNATAANLSTDPAKLTILAGNVALTIDTTVLPTGGVYDVKDRVVATFTSAGSLASGTLQIEGGVKLSGLSKSFSNIFVNGGGLSDGTLSAGSIASTGGAVSVTLGANFGDVTMSGTGTTLALSGASALYAGTLHIAGGTVALGSTTALGSGKVSFEGSGDTSVLRLGGNNTTLTLIQGATGNQLIENASATAATLTLNPAAAMTFGGTLRDGGSGALSLVKSGAGSVTLSGPISYTGGTTVSAGTLNLLGVALPSTGALTVSGGNVDLGGLTHTLGAVSLTSGAILNGTLTGSSYAAQAGQIAAILNGSAGFDKTTAGVVVLSGDNTLTGAMQVSGGTLQVSGAGKLSSGSLTVSGGASVDLGSTQQTAAQLRLASGSINSGTLNSSADFLLEAGQVGAVLAGSASLVKSTAGTVVLSGANNVLGMTDVQAGTLQVSGGGRLAAGSLKVSNAALVNLGGSNQTVGVVTLVSGAIQGGTLVGSSFDVRSGAVDAVLAGAGAALMKSTAGTVTLNAANTYGAGTTVSEGSLVLGVNNALAAAGSLTLNAGVLSIGSTQQAVGMVSLLSGSILGSGILSGASFDLSSGTVTAILSGSGSLQKSGPGTVTLSGANTLSGDMLVSGGSLLFSGSAALSSGSLQLSNGAVVDLGGRSRTTGAVTLTSGTLANGTLSGSAYTFESGMVSAALSGSGTFTKQTSGTAILAGEGSYSGAATIDAGTLLLRNGQALANAASVTQNGGALAFDIGVTAVTLRTLTGDLDLRNAGGGGVTLTLSPATDFDYTWIFSGANGSLVKNGASKLTLSGANTYTGSTTVSGGTIEAAAGALAATTSISVNGGALVAVDYNSAASLSVNATGRATISGSNQTVGSVTNANTADASVSFSSPTGLITIGSLLGSGSTRFESDASITGGIGAGRVSVAGSLTSRISGGSVSAATLSSAAISGGTVQVSGDADVALLSNGSLAVQGAALSINQLNGGAVSLGSSTVLTVNQGAFGGVISGGGSLVKTGAAALTLSGANTFSGATTVDAGSLVVTAGGGLANTSSITVNGAVFEAVNYNPAASLSVDASGRASLSGSNLSLGSVLNDNRVEFTSSSGTVAVSNLQGTGTTTFANNASLSGALVDGRVTVAGNLAVGEISGGVVGTRSLVSGTISGGSVIVGAGAAQVSSVLGGSLVSNGGVSLGTVASSGSVTLLGANNSIQTLQQGTLVLGSSARVAVTEGNSTADILGGGTLVKTGAGTTLTLGITPAVSVNVDVSAGTLAAGDLFSGSRGINVSAGANLAVTLAGDALYAGTLSGSGRTLLTSSAQNTFALAGTGLLDGTLTLSSVNLDLAVPNRNVFGDFAQLNFIGTGTLFLGDANQEVWLQQLDVAQTGAFLTVTGTGAKVLYDERPWFLSEENTLTTAGSASVSISGVQFDVLTKGGSLALSGGSYQYTAGRVRNRDGSPVSGTVLMLDPEKQSTIIRLSYPVTFSQEVIAGGSNNQGTISIQSAVYTPKITIGSNVHMVLLPTGLIQYGAADTRATDIYNSGTLTVSVQSGEKVLNSNIQGSGAFEKLDAGVLVLSGANGYTGATTLAGGVVVAASQTALGNSSVRFSGGSLKYAAGLGTAQISQPVVASGANITVDTNGNVVEFKSSVAGNGDLAKLGEGTLVVSGDATGLAGALSVTAGVLQVGAYGTGGALSQTSPIQVADSAVLRLARSADTALPQQIVSAGTIELAGAGSVVLSGSNNMAGGLVLGAGTLVLNSAGAIGANGSISMKGGVLKFGANNNTDYSSRFSTEPGQMINVDTADTLVEFARNLQGAGTTLHKAGEGVLVLSGVNGYNGATTISSGTLKLIGEQSGASSMVLNAGRLVYSLASAGTSSGSVVSARNSVVEFNVGDTHQFGGSISGEGAVFKSGAGLLSLTSALLNTGGLSLNSGTVRLSGSEASLVSVGSATLQNASVLDVRKGVINRGAEVAVLGSSKLQLGNDTLFLSSISLAADAALELDPSLSATIFVTGSILDNRVTKASNVEILNLTSNIPTSKLRGNVSNPEVMDVLSFERGANVTLLNKVSTQALSTAENTTVVFRKDVTVAGAVFFGGGTISLQGALTAEAAPVVIGTSSSSAYVAVSGSSAAILSPAVLLNGGTLALSSSALQALRSVGTLQIGGPGGGSGDAVLKVGDTGTETLELSSGQTLKGSGTIAGNLTLSDSSSSLRPGNSPGTLKILGSVNLTGGLLEIEVGATQQDQIETSGAAVSIGSGATLRLVIYDGALLGGGTLKPLFINGANPVTATGAGFGSVEFCRLDPALGAVYSAMYGVTGPYSALSIVRKRFDAISGLSSNARAFASALDALVITKGNTSTRLLELGTGSTAVEAAVRVPLQLAAGSPAAYAELAGLSTQRTLSLSQGLVDHFNAIRKGLTDVPEDEYSAWTSAYGSWHKQSANASIGAAGYNGNTWGDLLGVEKRFGNLVAGVLAAAGQSSATFSSLSGNVSTDSWHAGGYATLKAGNYVLESGAFFGVTDNTARRSISAPGMLSQQGRWKPSGNEWLTQIGLTRPMEVSGKVTLTPSLRLLAQGQSLYAANESNLGGLEVATRRQQTYSVHHQAGVEARRSFKLGSKAAAAALQLDWLHDYRPEGRSLRMALAGDSAATYGCRGSAAGADAFHVGASFEMALTRRATVRLTLDYQAQSEASVTRGALSLGYSF